jgi:hypothetical protein
MDLEKSTDERFSVCKKLENFHEFKRFFICLKMKQQKFEEKKR